MQFKELHFSIMAHAYGEKSESGFWVAWAETFPLAHKGRKAGLQQFLTQECKLWGDEVSLE